MVETPRPPARPDEGDRPQHDGRFRRWPQGLGAAAVAALLAALGGFAPPAAAQDPPPALPAACAPNLPFGAPSPAFPGDTLLCRGRLAIAHDPDAKTPRWVAHLVTAADAWSCEDRQNQFRADSALPRSERAELSDYAGSGWDRGHMAADADLRADPKAASDADRLSNIVPQSPPLNRGLWNRIEAMVRVWGADRGAVWVLTSRARTGETLERRIGPGGVLVPDVLFKVVVDAARGEGIAFFVPNTPFGWREDPARFVVPFAVVEEAVGFWLPRPPGTAEASAPWPADVGRFAQAKELFCATGGVR